MRENMGLHRGKRLDNREWVEGNLIYDTENNRAFIAECFDAEYAYIQRVNPDTVGECSGVPDKDGVRIYEGDILKITYLCQKPVTAVVEFTDGKFVARYTRNGKEHIDNLTATASSLYKIIGNIHDNPELLKGE